VAIVLTSSASHIVRAKIAAALDRRQPNVKDQTLATLPPKQDILQYELFTLFRTTPLFYDDGQRKDGPIGSATFFEILGRMFLITANHVFEDIHPSVIRIPRKPKSTELVDLGEYDLLSPSDPRYDICALEITDRVKARELKRAGWDPLTLSNVMAPSPNGTFLLFGFPYAIKDTGKVLQTYNGLSAYANRIQSRPPEADNLLTDDLDLFFEYGAIGDAHDGTEVATPKLEGASGCSVWEVQPYSSFFVFPRVVGVQIRARQGKYFRALAWKAVGHLLGQVDPQIGRAVSDALKL
jgi:hypothetical protein